MNLVKERRRKTKSLCGDMEADEALEALGLRMVWGGQGNHSQPEIVHQAMAEPDIEALEV